MRNEALRQWAVALGIGVATAWVFAPALQFDFVSFDDWRLVRDNPFLRESLGWDSLRRAFEAPYYLNWIPLTTLSYHVDAARAGLDPRAFHATNLALHALASGLLFLALARLTRREPESAFVALVFALHPLHVEPVAWIASRKDVLSGAFSAATLLAYAHYARQPTAARYAGVVLALGGALLAKPMAVTLPFVLMLLDVWPLERLRGDGARRVWLEKLPLLGLAAIVAGITYAVQNVVEVGGHDFGLRAANAVDSLGAYLLDAVWPSGLAAFYPHPGASLPLGRVLVVAVVLGALVAGIWQGRERHPWLGVGALWFGGMLLPVLGFIEVGLQARADRYMYFPLIGLALAVTFTATAIWGASRRGRLALGALALGCVLAMTVATRAQLPHWRDSEALYRRAIDVTEGNALAHYGLAGILAEQGALDASREQLQAAIAANPGWSLPYERWAQLERHRGDLAAARAVLERLLELRPGDAVLHANLAELRLRDGDAARAIHHFEQARAGRPGWGEPASQLAWLLATHPDPALRDPEQALSLVEALLARARLREPVLLDTLAAAHAARGDFEAALGPAREATELTRQGGDLEQAAARAARAEGYARGRPYFATPAEPRPRLNDPGDAPLR